MANRMTKLLTVAALIGAPAGALAEPRRLANGAPACGNTMSKRPSAYRCTAEELAEYRAAQEAERQENLRAEEARRIAATARRTPVQALAHAVAHAFTRTGG